MEPSESILSVLLFNVGCGSKTANNDVVADQCTGIKCIIKHVCQEPNLFVFCQDQVEGKKRKTIQTSLSILETDREGFRTTIACNQNDRADIFEDHRSGSSHPTAELTHPSKFEPFMFLERLAARTLNMNGQKILLVSWHGPHTGLTPDMKARGFHYLISSVAKVQKKITADIVILGGDFNISLENAASAHKQYKTLSKTIPNGSFVPDPDRYPGFKTSIDFVVVWPRDRVDIVEEYPQVLMLDNENFPDVGDYPFRHKVPVTGGGGGDEVVVEKEGEDEKEEEGEGEKEKGGTGEEGKGGAGGEEGGDDEEEEEGDDEEEEGDKEEEGDDEEEEGDKEEEGDDEEEEGDKEEEGDDEEEEGDKEEEGDDEEEEGDKEEGGDDKEEGGDDKEEGGDDKEEGGDEGEGDKEEGRGGGGGEEGEKDEEKKEKSKVPFDHPRVLYRFRIKPKATPVANQSQPTSDDQVDLVTDELKTTQFNTH